jgi:hypothetical protein
MNYKKITSIDQVKIGDKLQYHSVDFIVIEKLNKTIAIEAVAGHGVFVELHKVRWITEWELLNQFELEVKEERWKPEARETYYFPDTRSESCSSNHIWQNDDIDKRLFERGQIYKLPKEAKEAAKAMIEFNKSRNK